MNKDWLDIGVLEDYLDGKLDAKTMNRVEREALDDPFVAEALAGLSESPKRSLQSLSLLQKQLHERVAQHQSVKKTSVITWQRLSIAATAAVMFVAVSIMFWMRENNHQKELAGMSKKVEVTIAPKTPEMPEVATETPVLAKEAAETKTEKEIDKAIKAAKTNVYASKVKRKSSPVSQADASAEQLDEVAIVGYGVQKKQSITGAVSYVPAPAASHLLSGKVVAGDDGKPLPGVALRMEGTRFGAVTDANGEFKMNMDTSIKEGKIRADYIGFRTAEMLAKVNEPVNISLKPYDQSLNEVVVGYSKAKKKELTTDSPAISGVLEGRVAGISTNNTIRIRGMSTLSKMPVMVSNPIGGWDKLFSYIQENNSFAKEKKTGQSVELSFRVDKKGTPTDIEVIKGADDQYEQEAIRLILNGPKWERPVKSRSRMTFKIDF